MNMISEFLARRRAKIAAQRLAATLKPCPELRARRLAQMDAKRAERCRKNMAEIQAEIGQT